MKNKLKTVPFDTMIDKHIGKKGTPRRDAFENELRIEILEAHNFSSKKSPTDL